MVSLLRQFILWFFFNNPSPHTQKHIHKNAITKKQATQVSIIQLTMRIY